MTRVIDDKSIAVREFVVNMGTVTVASYVHVHEPGKKSRQLEYQELAVCTPDEAKKYWERFLNEGFAPVPGT